MGSVVIGPCKTNKIINNFKGTLTEFGAEMLLSWGWGGQQRAVIGCEDHHDSRLSHMLSTKQR